MLKVAVIDDDKYILEEISESLNKILAQFGVEAVVEKFTSGISFIKKDNFIDYDLIFLDIEMPELSGFETARIIRAKTKKIYIVFVTTHSELVYESFDYQPFNFIAKDNSELTRVKLRNVVNILLEYEKQNKLIMIDIGFSKIMKVQIKDIVYVSSNKNYVYYHLENSEQIISRQKLSNSEKEISNCDFVRVHRRYIINMRYISGLDFKNERIFLSGYFPENIKEENYSLEKRNIEVPISRGFKKSFEEKYRNYLRIIK